MKIAVRAARNHAETAAAIYAGQQRSIRFEDLVFVFRVHDQVAEVKRTPHHEQARIQPGPAVAAIIGTIESTLLRFDVGVDHLRFRGRHCDRDSSPGFFGKALAVAFVEFGPVIATVGGSVESAARAAGAEGPALAAEIPQRSEHSFWFLRAHGDQPATRGSVGATQYFFPRLPAIRGQVDSALLVVIPQVAGGADQDAIAVFGIDQDFRDVLGVVQPHVGPVLAAVGGLVDPISNRNTVPHPRFSRYRPTRSWDSKDRSPLRQSTAPAAGRKPA